MNKIIIIAITLVSVCFSQSFAQSAFKITDSTPAIINGLAMGFHINSAREQEVGKKGNFSRYSLNFYITNTSAEAKIILYKDCWNLMGNTSDQLAQFNCLNATGARLTTKSAVLNAPACNVLASVDDKDGSGKAVKNKRFVQIGYWIRAGQTISTNGIVIVTLNEQPNVEVTYLVNQLQPTASAFFPNMPNTAFPSMATTSSDFMKIKSAAKDMYLNIQNGPLACTPVDLDWWSAQWQLIPVENSGYYLLKNKWKDVYISTELSDNLLSGNYQTKAARWIVEPIENSSHYRIRNVATNNYLNIQSGTIQCSNVWNNAPGAHWFIEP